MDLSQRIIFHKHRPRNKENNRLTKGKNKENNKRECVYMFLLKGGSSNNLGPNQNFLL
jgi:hypothetical protein